MIIDNYPFGQNYRARCVWIGVRTRPREKSEQPTPISIDMSARIRGTGTVSGWCVILTQLVLGKR